MKIIIIKSAICIGRTQIFDWSDMCEVKLPIPSIEKQQAIVKIYHVLEKRKQINEQLKAKIKDICPVLMRVVIEKQQENLV